MTTLATLRARPRFPVEGAPGVLGAAVFGEPGEREALWRYALLREWGQGPRTVAFCGVNPSTAVAHKDDPTVRRCWGFAKRWGYDRLVMLNVFAYRSTDPNGLDTAEDPIGRENDAWLRGIHQDADLTVAAWGNNALRFDRHVEVLRVFESVGKPLHALGTTNHGLPKHPLARGLHRIPDEAVPIPYAGAPNAAHPTNRGTRHV